MNIKYFRDTETALLAFSREAVDETREISRNVHVDLDRRGNIVSMTMGHAAALASFPQVHLEEVGLAAAE